jgi:hypothetical protein
MSHEVAEIVVVKKLIADAMEVISIGPVLGTIRDLFGSLDTVLDGLWEF